MMQTGGCRSGGGELLIDGAACLSTASLLGSSEFASPMLMTGAHRFKGDLVRGVLSLKCFLIIFHGFNEGCLWQADFID